MNLSWLAEVVFFGSYFIAWLTNELAHSTWVTVSAFAALVVAILLLGYNGAPYVVRRAPQA